MKLSGGTIRDWDDHDADLNHPQLGTQANHKVDGSLNPDNNAPTASDNTVTTDEDEDYTFRPADFNFGDADTSDALSSVKIVTLEMAGDMELNGTDVTENQMIVYIAIWRTPLLYFLRDALPGWAENN